VKCEYGCGRVTTHQFKNGKWCCESYHNKCPELKRKTSESVKGKTPWNKGKTGIYSEESLALMSDSKKGKTPWNKGKTEIYSEETLKKISESGKGRTPWNKGKTDHLSKESLDKISKSKKGQIPWNKGKTGIFSDESLALMSEKSKRENLSEETRKRMSIGCTGRVQSQEMIRKRAESIRGKTWTEEQKQRLRKAKENISIETRRKLRIKALERIQNSLEKGYQLRPNYNPAGCKLIDEYGNKHGFNFQHAENGGEYFISKLGYWVDGYDEERNIVIEVDEPFHYDSNGNLSEKDIIRQEEIINFLKCDFIRMKIDNSGEVK